MKRIRSFFRLPAVEKWLFAEALFWLYLSKLLLMRSFARVQRRLQPADTFRKPADRATLVRVSRAVARADRLACWENRCLVKSLAARFMLQNRQIGSVLCLGLQVKQEKELAAHAWLESGGVFVTPRGDKAFKEIYKV